MMKTTTVSAPRPGALNSAANNGKTNVAAATTLSVRRLNVMRIGYAVMGAGIAARNWPSLEINANLDRCRFTARCDLGRQGIE